MAALGASLKVLTVLKEDYILPFNSCYENPPQEPLPGGGIALAFERKGSRTGHDSQSLGFYNRQAPKLNSWSRPTIDLSTMNKFEKDRVIQNGDTRNNKKLPTSRGVGHLHRFQRRILAYTDSKSVQEVHVFSHPGSVLPI